MIIYKGLDGEYIKPMVGDLTSAGRVIEITEDGRLVTDRHVQGSFDPAHITFMGRSRSIELKPLIWSEHRKPNAECNYTHCIAETVFGRFLLTWKGWKSEPCQDMDIGFDETPWGDCWYDGWGTPEQAKADAIEKFRETVCSLIVVKKPSGAALCACGKPGKERMDSGLACGIHCDECFSNMVRGCRSRSW